MAASDWLLKIVGRQAMTSCQKIAPKKLISLTSWDPSDHIFEDDVTYTWLGIGGEDLRKIVGKRRQGFGNGWQGMRKKCGEGWMD